MKQKVQFQTNCFLNCQIKGIHLCIWNYSKGSVNWVHQESFKYQHVLLCMLFLLLEKSYKITSMQKAANQIVRCKGKELPARACARWCAGAVAAGFSPGVWYRTPRLAVSFLEDTGCRRTKHKQEKNRQCKLIYSKAWKKPETMYVNVFHLQKSMQLDNS